MKTPLGILLPESQADKSNIEKYLTKDSYVITVGDRTTEKMMGFDLVPSLQIIDGQEKREKREPPKLSNATELTVDNPAAEITPQSVAMIKKAFTLQGPVRIFVNGEEDLLVLPACIHAPENAVVLYGQPNQGLVIVRITPEIRNKVQRLLDLME
ncbi:MAG: GTP-dependent dephospho-CoA kinase family protein [Nitrosopumilus sp.]|nr:GTP-dependent dephospho-CoA kinase family protein [Nitrosopumilus sp.]MDF2423011.1 GTP-dependent dephospho-CoA kinase family protein [Nitrosopumilus sp.]MDF2424359.1 GTP-dependent dephospho-CoA kinase family protein [Nitrosopumilus sp.]MDF2424895.1 GTP-dependent dephospho-CoA kinase family protein [Nitrosopumilus sp.]MDF2428380.1 GTP-dependent dephospho-CoA kinase family protein [Nitrosopumilus sp.]